MSDTTKIEWADSTFNPWIGCTKVSTAAGGGGGCDFCYAEVSTPARVLRARDAETWGPGAPRQRTSATNWRQPLRWEASADEFMASHGRRRRVFCASLADVFDNEVDKAWRADLFALIRATPRLEWLLLTKRVGNVARMAMEANVGAFLEGHGFAHGLPGNVQLGISVVNRPEMLRDAGKLRALTDRGFWSYEPALGQLGEIPVDLFPGWVIAGGESGPHARPAHPDWFRSLRDQCAAAGVPFLFKQWGEWAPGSNWPDDIAIPSGERCDFGDDSLGDAGSVWRVGKKAAGRMLDGVEHNGFPEVRHA